MVNPGLLPLAIVRGTSFNTLILQCKDENVLVSGTLVPNVTGEYVPSGTYSSYPLFILAGSPATFLYYNSVALTYVISRTLTNGALTDYWSPAAPLTEPTGTYAPHGANTGTATADDNPTNLTGYTVEAKVRRSEKVGAEVILDLDPSVTDAVNGEITIPSISSDETNVLPYVINARWDLLLVNSGLDRLPPIVYGPFSITDNITQSTPPPP